MKQIRTITLYGGQGLTAEISNYGAKLLSLIVPNRQGEKKDIVLGFKTIEEWQQKETYFNAIIGRYANRIKNGRFSIDGKSYQLPVNNGTNALHGGVSGFNEKIWDIVGQTRHSVSLHYRALDGEENYPGNYPALRTEARWPR